METNLQQHSKSINDVIVCLEKRIQELYEEADELEEEGLYDSALTSECTRQELEEILSFVKGE